MEVKNETDLTTTIMHRDPLPRLYSISKISTNNTSTMMSKWTLPRDPQMPSGPQLGMRSILVVRVKGEGGDVGNSSLVFEIQIVLSSSHLHVI